MEKRTLNLQFFAEDDPAAAAVTAGEPTGEEPAAGAAAGETVKNDPEDRKKEAQEPEKDARAETDIAQLVAEEVKKATMNEEERRAYDDEQREKAMQAREEAIAMRELTADARTILVEQGLPESFLGMVLGKDKSDTEARAKALKEGFDSAVQKQVGERLKGTTPGTGTGVTGMSSADVLQSTVEKYL